MIDIAGARVARQQFGTVHIAARWGDPGVVLTRCGNTVAHPQFQRLMGTRCPVCYEVEPAQGKGLTRLTAAGKGPDTGGSSHEEKA